MTAANMFILGSKCSDAGWSFDAVNCVAGDWAGGNAASKGNSSIFLWLLK